LLAPPWRLGWGVGWDPLSGAEGAV
jgi:hypothetical protein